MLIFPKIFNEIRDIISAEQVILQKMRKQIEGFTTEDLMEKKLLKTVEKQIDLGSFMLELGKEAIDDYEKGIVLEPPK